MWLTHTQMDRLYLCQCVGKIADGLRLGTFIEPTIESALTTLKRTSNRTPRLAAVEPPRRVCSLLWTKLSGWPSPSSLCHFVSDVVCMRSGGKVIWIYASRIVALVHHNLRLLSRVNEKRKSVNRNYGMTFATFFTFSVGRDVPIPFFGKSACPMPAPAFVFGNLLPESGVCGVVDYHQRILP
jgi:hypothetical protein